MKLPCALRTRIAMNFSARIYVCAGAIAIAIHQFKAGHA